MICSLFLWDAAFGGICFSRPNTRSSNSAPVQVMRGGGGSSRGGQMPSPQWQRQKVPRNRANNSTPRTSAATVNPYEYANRTSSLSRTHSEEAIGGKIDNWFPSLYKITNLGSINFCGYIRNFKFFFCLLGQKGPAKISRKIRQNHKNLNFKISSAMRKIRMSLVLNWALGSRQSNQSRTDQNKFRQ